MFTIYAWLWLCSAQSTDKGTREIKQYDKRVYQHFVFLLLFGPYRANHKYLLVAIQKHWSLFKDHNLKPVICLSNLSGSLYCLQTGISQSDRWRFHLCVLGKWLYGSAGRLTAKFQGSPLVLLIFVFADFLIEDKNKGRKAASSLPLCAFKHLPLKVQVQTIFMVGKSAYSFLTESNNHLVL